MATQFGSQINYPAATQVEAWEGQWGARLTHSTDAVVTLTKVGAHCVAGVSDYGLTLVSDADLAAASSDITVQHAMDIDGGDTGAAISASINTLFSVYWCADGTFARGLGFYAGSPSLHNGVYILKDSGTSPGGRCFFLGWAYVDGTGKILDQEDARQLVNYYNRRPTRLRLRPAYNDNNAGTTFARTLNAWGTINAGTGDTGTYVANGEDSFLVTARFSLGAAAPAAVVQVGIGDDSTTQPAAVGDFANAAAAGTAVSVQTVISQTAGKHTLTMLCYTANLATTFEADYARNGAAADPSATALEALIPT